ncbi:MAG: hypothetical protein ACREMP_05445 [Candidatus Tyrphobacter sp.]
MSVLGLDPGTRKAGYALLARDGRVIERGIEPLDGLSARLATLLRRYPIETIAVGRGTNAALVTGLLVSLGVAFELVDERESTLLARRLYYAENPARGLQRLLPLGLRYPPRPIDDYAAEIIARRCAALHGGETWESS